MSTAEVTAYLLGVDIGRGADVLTISGDRLDVTPDMPIPPSVAWACAGMTGDQFRYWMLRGVGDAWRA